MRRRDFIKLFGTSALSLSASPSIATQLLSSDHSNWTSYRITYQVTLPAHGKSAHLWLPLPDSNDSDTIFQFTQGSNWYGNTTKASFSTLGKDPFPIFKAEWHGKEQSDRRHVTVNCIVKTVHHAIDPTLYPENKKQALPNSIRNYINPTQLKPTNGIVRETAHAIIKEKNASTPLEQARAIYDWIINNTQYDENTRGRGQGNVTYMLENNELSGKCVDLNSLLVALLKAADIPARNQYGIRINDSDLHESIGQYGDISQSQHCRAEFFLAGRGWIPVNPSDVLQVLKLGGLTLDDAKIIQLREKFFGAWEMNWLAFNHAEDIAISPSSSSKFPFFMYPHAEIDGNSLDNLDPENFSYKIISAELVGTGIKF
ncbi:transglutaminase-like domain-containing protein [Nitrosomonas ureae]|uniref:Transglutaminase-like enzyme, putative cysteine protease n=1 Tax=Nitrosomonas ureae TaxID=44577 RepID=A0A286AC94_9PROT|nr:transglutaminase domain-containing protein [Nitrosomonas ureae]SOD19495.1 Transglutaminase-like enzyme, putative cysteine protease [Nitrosomonas ureae]